jgi:pyruvate-formate lyase-activating enzyme
MNPRNGGNYTQPEVIRDKWGGEERIEYVAFVGGEEISRWDNAIEAAHAVFEGLEDAGILNVIEIHTSNVEEVAHHASAA